MKPNPRGLPGRSSSANAAGVAAEVRDIRRIRALKAAVSGTWSESREGCSGDQDGLQSRETLRGLTRASSEDQRQGVREGG